MFALELSTNLNFQHEFLTHASCIIGGSKQLQLRPEGGSDVCLTLEDFWHLQGVDLLGISMLVCWGGTAVAAAMRMIANSSALGPTMAVVGNVFKRFNLPATYADAMQRRTLALGIPQAIGVKRALVQQEVASSKERALAFLPL